MSPVCATMVIVTQATLETARLSLRPLVDEHLEHEVELDTDPQVMHHLAPRPSTREAVEAAHRRRLALAAQVPGMGLWAGFVGDGFVGWWLLRPREPVGVDGEAELGYRLLPRCWGRGLAREGARALLRHGFVDLGLRRIFGETMVVNAASRATMAAVGMAPVRTFPLTGREPRPGLTEGGVEYALTLEDWYRAHPDGPAAGR